MIALNGLLTGVVDAKQTKSKLITKSDQQSGLYKNTCNFLPDCI